jgi:hypothetical protein
MTRGGLYVDDGVYVMRKIRRVGAGEALAEGCVVGSMGQEYNILDDAAFSFLSFLAFDVLKPHFSGRRTYLLGYRSGPILLQEWDTFFYFDYISGDTSRMSAVYTPMSTKETINTTISIMPSSKTTTSIMSPFNTTSTSAMSTTTPFLDILPPELRTHIYTHLLTTPHPLKGLTARGQMTYGIHTAILRTNKQIYSEARHVFFGRNTFSVSSVPLTPSAESSESSESSESPLGTGAFEPPLQLKDLSLVRHLSIDLLYPNAANDTGAQRYITNISYLLSHLSPATVKSLTITADTASTSLLNESECPSTTISAHEPPLNIRTFLLPFHFADLTPRFACAIAALKIETLAMRFEFADMVFDFQVPRDVAGRGGLVGFAGRVLVKRGEIALRGVWEELGCEGGDELEFEDGMEEEEGRVVCDWVC